MGRRLARVSQGLDLECGDSSSACALLMSFEQIENIAGWLTRVINDMEPEAGCSSIRAGYLTLLHARIQGTNL
jgi:hypothetical protein